MDRWITMMNKLFFYAILMNYIYFQAHCAENNILNKITEILKAEDISLPEDKKMFSDVAKEMKISVPFYIVRGLTKATGYHGGCCYYHNRSASVVIDASTLQYSNKKRIRTTPLHQPAKLFL